MHALARTRRRHFDTLCHPSREAMSCAAWPDWAAEGAVSGHFPRPDLACVCSLAAPRGA